MSGPSADLSPVIAATAHWLVRAFPSPGGLRATLAELQARQAVTVAAWLRYPDEVAAGLLVLTGPGGSGRLDRLFGPGPAAPDADGDAWRSWVDEVVASWSACLLGDAALAAGAVSALTGGDRSAGPPAEFRRLTAPGARDRAAAPLLRHPDLLAPLADLHRGALLHRLDPARV